MTEGIIQQVFQKFHKQSYGDCASEQDVDELLSELEKELIEKIKDTCEAWDETDEVSIALTGESSIK